MAIEAQTQQPEGQKPPVEALKNKNTPSIKPESPDSASLAASQELAQLAKGRLESLAKFGGKELLKNHAITAEIGATLKEVKQEVTAQQLTDTLSTGINFKKTGLMGTDKTIASTDRALGVGLTDQGSALDLQLGVLQGCKLAGSEKKQDMLAMQVSHQIDDSVSIGGYALADTAAATGSLPNSYLVAGALTAHF